MLNDLLKQRHVRSWAGLPARLIAHVRTPLFFNGYALTLSAALTSGLGVVYWVLATNLYHTEVVGSNAALIAAMMFVSGMANLSLTSVMIRFIPQAGRATRKLVGYAYLICMSTVALAGLLFTLGVGAWFPELGPFTTDPLFRFWFIVSGMTWSIFSLQDSVLAGLKQAIWVPIENTIFAVIKIALLVLFATAFTQYGIFASWTIPVLLSIVPINLIIFWRLIPRHIEVTASQSTPLAPPQIAKYVASNYLGALFSLSTTTLLPIIVIYQAGATANAYFSQPWMIAGALQFLATNMATSLTVEAATDQKQLESYCRRVLANTARLLVPAAALTLLAAPLILQIFGQRYAAEGTLLLRLLALAAIPNMVNTLYISTARVRGQTLDIVAIQGVICVLTLGLSYALLPQYHIIAVGAAWLTSQTIVAIVLLSTKLRGIVFD